MPVGFLLRLYFNSLAKGNPFTIFLTAVMAVAISVGPFYEGLSKRDPVAITMVCIFGGLILLALGIVVYDKRKTLAEEKKRLERAQRINQRIKPRSI